MARSFESGIQQNPFDGLIFAQQLIYLDWDFNSRRHIEGPIENWFDWLEVKGDYLFVFFHTVSLRGSAVIFVRVYYCMYWKQGAVCNRVCEVNVGGRERIHQSTFRRPTGRKIYSCLQSYAKTFLCLLLRYVCVLCV